MFCAMNTHRSPDAGLPADPAHLADIPLLVTAYYAERPDPAAAAERVAFGTSGHRGSSLSRSFNERHILAVAHAICLYRRKQSIDGPLFMGFDTHALSYPAFVTALEVLAADGVRLMIAGEGEYTPTPAISQTIIAYNRGRSSGLADGIVITPSHNPPEDGGFKYNPPHGGPAGSDVTGWIEARANEILASGEDIPRLPYAHALQTATRFDFVETYTSALADVVDMDALAQSGLHLAVDALGGAGLGYWARIAERYRLDLTVLNAIADPTFRFMTRDWDGKIRMDPSSPDAMRSLIALKDGFDLAFACDTDHDRHGIVTRAGLMPPNHYLAVCADYLLANRPGWREDAAIGKTAVSSAIIDRVAARNGRHVYETPVGFKWFVEGLCDGSLGFVGEESAGATLLDRNGNPWTTDKDGMALGLLSAEITARTGRNPGELYAGLAEELGASSYRRSDAPASPELRTALSRLKPEDVTIRILAGDPVVSVMTTAPGNGAALGGVKVASANGWFAARPSGTENVYKIYAESFVGEAHLDRIEADAQLVVTDALSAAVS
jgi:phosphoglucomutase